MIEKYNAIVDDLLTWYDANKRSLPWRDDPKPYYVWVSEIMLQQTRVEAVKGYFARFMTELPTIEALANVDEDKLMKLWEGLGYYNRVRNLQKAAKVVMEEYNGQLPNTYEELIKLPGIGSYTAGAIASIAFGQRVPAVDGNVLRITKRITSSFDDITKAKVVKEVEKDLREIMPERSGDFNQALMDLGATVCIPNGKPLCEQCPLNIHCMALKEDVVLQLPVKPSKKPRKIEEKTILLFEWDGKYAIQQRPGKGLLARMWELPNIEGKISIEELEVILVRMGIQEYEIGLLGRAKHIFSHVEWHMIGYSIIIKQYDSSQRMQPELVVSYVKEENEEILASENIVSLEHCQWVTKEQLEHEFALPTAFEAYKNWKE